MLAPSPTPADQSDAIASRLLTEAEALVNLLLDFDISLAVHLDNERLLIELGDGTPDGAFAVANVVTERFKADEQFREDVIAAVSALGEYVADAPGINADLRAEPAPYVVDALAMAGLDVVLQRDANLSWAAAILRFQARPESIAPNAHLLMRLAADRYQNDPEFAGQLADYLDARDSNDIPD